MAMTCSASGVSQKKLENMRSSLLQKFGLRCCAIGGQESFSKSNSINDSVNNELCTTNAC
jgi:hypothetical protein